MNRPNTATKGKDVVMSMNTAEASFYEDSMRPLVYKDIQKALNAVLVDGV